MRKYLSPLHILILISGILPGCFAHTCIHDQIERSGFRLDGNGTLIHESKYMQSRQLYEHRDPSGRLLQTSTYKSIRIKVDTSRLMANGDGNFACYAAGQSYRPTIAKFSTDTATCTSADVLTTAQRDFLINTLIPAAVSFFTSTLSVIPVVGNLLLPNPNSDSFCCQSGSYCYSLVCCESNFPSNYKTVGVADADYLLIVTARPTSGSVLAWATECQADQYSRPLCGHANIAPAPLSTAASALESQIGVITHEFSHALGFSGGKFSSFRKPGTNLRVSSSSDVIQSSYDSTLGKVTNKIITPKVVSWIQTHYNCPSSSWPNIGAEIEDFGGSGTAGSHWEKRNVMNELMNPVSEGVMYKSGLTLSLFEDSGWYQVNYAAADDFPYGKNQGCDFVQQKCNKRSSAYFCKTGGESGCTADMRFHGTCNLADFGGSVASQYQYFSSSATASGTQPHADYCPYYEPVSNKDCRNAGMSSFFWYGEQPGPNAKCWMGTYQISGSTTPLTMHGGCLLTSCDSLTNLIKISLSGTPPTVVICPKDGGTVDVGAIPNSKYKGTIICPPSSRLCTGSPCDNQNCNGQGTCNPADGTCTCKTNYYGSDAYSCEYMVCPGGTSTTPGCSGHGTCSKTTGQCTCQAGYSGLDCSRQGCPLKNNVECAGKGSCNTTSGLCSCYSGFIGADCGLTDCPKKHGLPCSGSTQGQCDSTFGVCNCLDAIDANSIKSFYSGYDCSIVNNRTRNMTSLYFLGEANPATNATGEPVSLVLKPKEYSYATFNVPSVSYPLKLTLDISSLPSSATPPIVIASYAGAADRPNVGSYEFGPAVISTDLKSMTLLFSASQDTSFVSAFSKTGVIVVSMILLDSTLSVTSSYNVNLTLSRDGCAVLKCAFGTCKNGQCVCDQKSEASWWMNKYGWRGELCDQPDCPGTPDCSGTRGSCMVPNAAYTNGVPNRNVYPFCQCSSVFSGESCSSYSFDDYSRIVSANLVADTWSGTSSRYTNSDGDLERAWFNDGSGKPFINGTYKGTLGQGDGITKPRVVIDPFKLDSNGFSALSSGGFIGLYARLDFSSTPLADGMLFSQINTPPSLSSFRNFDVKSWREASPIQEISTTISDITFLSVFNGLYSKSALSYSLYIELSPTCPPGLNGCSGQGTCSFGVCSCSLGWEGIRCDVYVPLILNGEVAESPELEPGRWVYYIFQPMANSQEIILSLNPSSIIASDYAPLLAAAWDGGRFGTSLAKVSSESVFVHLDNVTSRSGIQTVILRRSNPSSQAYLYIGLRNLPFARASFFGLLKVSEFSSSTMSDCKDTPEKCRESKCSGKGTYSVVNGKSSCICDFGWNSDSFCRSPSFSSFSNILSAAQTVSYLCAVCTDQAPYSRNQLQLFKVSQPLQKGTGLKLSVKPVSPNVTTVAAGYPSLLVSATLPRSILDFLFVASSSSQNQSMLVTETSATGSYWAAVYANTPGTFLLGASRAKLSIPPPVDRTSIEDFINFVYSSVAAKVVIGVGFSLFLLMLLSCLVDCFCSRGLRTGKFAEAIHSAEEAHDRHDRLLERSLAKVKAVSDYKLASTPSLAKVMSRSEMNQNFADVFSGSNPMLSGPSFTHLRTRDSGGASAGRAKVTSVIINGANDLQQVQDDAFAALRAASLAERSSSRPKPEPPAGIKDDSSTNDMDDVSLVRQSRRAPVAEPTGPKDAPSGRNRQAPREPAGKKAPIEPQGRKNQSEDD